MTTRARAAALAAPLIRDLVGEKQAQRAVGLVAAALVEEGYHSTAFDLAWDAVMIPFREWEEDLETARTMAREPIGRAKR